MYIYGRNNVKSFNYSPTLKSIECKRFQTDQNSYHSVYQVGWKTTKRKCFYPTKCLLAIFSVIIFVLPFLFFFSWFFEMHEFIFVRGLTNIMKCMWSMREYKKIQGYTFFAELIRTYMNPEPDLWGYLQLELMRITLWMHRISKISAQFRSNVWKKNVVLFHMFYF